MISSSPTTNSIPEEAAVLDTVLDFLSGIKERDKALMLSHLLPNTSACLIRNGQPLHVDFVAYIERTVPWDSDDRLDEQIYNAKVLVDGEIAMAWTPYVVYRNDKPQHTGTNIMSFWKREGKWVISCVADIARKVELKDPPELNDTDDQGMT